MGMDGKRHATANLPLGKILNTHLTGDCVGPIVPMERCGKSRSTGIRPRTDRPVASHYTD